MTETLRETGSCVVQLSRGIMLHALHVNTVGNQKCKSVVYSDRLRRYSRLQSNTTKTRRVSRLRFVSDKKRLCSQHGYKNTRIEFSAKPSRSANYTSNAKPLLQAYFRGVFETVAIAQGVCVTSTKPFRVSNENLTSYMYGVANPLTVVIRMRNTKSFFHTPFFFSSVNVATNDRRHQLFASMSINSQKVKHTDELVDALEKVTAFVELHTHANRLCCELAHDRRGMLTSREKLCIVYLTETYFLNTLDRSNPSHWADYRTTVTSAYVHRYKSQLSPVQDKTLNNYHMKNPEFIHIVPWLLDNPCELHDSMLLSHERYLTFENKLSARAELIVVVATHATKSKKCHVPEGFPGVRDVDFGALDYTLDTLTNAIRNTRVIKVSRHKRKTAHGGIDDAS